MLWYDICATWMICDMIDIQMTNWHEIQPWNTHGRYDMKEDSSGVVVYDNENGKVLGPHALLCVHALGDTPSPLQ